MQISFREMVPKDEVFLSQLLESSFNSDSELAFGSGVKLGPPGYDDGSLAKKIIANTSLKKLIILANNHECGTLVYSDVVVNEIHYLCLSPDYINQGIGSKVWHLFENNRAGLWQLETPDFSLRNHAFYMKNGFVKVAEKEYGKTSKSFIFEKMVK